MPVKKKKIIWIENDCFFKSIYMNQRVVQQIQRSRKREFNADHIIYDEKN